MRPFHALQPTNPHTFPAAGMSHETQINAARAMTLLLVEDTIIKPSHNLGKSFTTGSRIVLITLLFYKE